MLILVNGMMRSGSTLQYNIGAKVMEAVGPIRWGGFKGRFDDRATLASLCKFRDSAHRTILKTHERPLPLDFYTEDVCILFSYRDVRDIAASMKKKWKFPFTQILKNIDSMIEIESAITALPRVLIQPYEILYFDMAQAVNDVSRHLDVVLDNDQIAKIVLELSLTAVNERIQKRKKNPLVRLTGALASRFSIERKTLLHNNHVSESLGRDGEWIHEFSAEEKEILNCRYSIWLKTHGYLNREYLGD